jgi:hypothetical protein
MKKYLPDVMLMAGAGCFSYGAWSAWPPAGWLVAGALLIAAGIQIARAE